MTCQCGVWTASWAPEVAYPRGRGAREQARGVLRCKAAAARLFVEARSRGGGLMDCVLRCAD